MIADYSSLTSLQMGPTEEMVCGDAEQCETTSKELAAGGADSTNNENPLFAEPTIVDGSESTLVAEQGRLLQQQAGSDVVNKRSNQQPSPISTIPASSPAPNFSATPQYHHHRRRPLLMLFHSSSEAAAVLGISPMKRVEVGSRFVVSPTPNALPAATAGPEAERPYSPSNAPSSPIAKALSLPLRVIVTENNARSREQSRSPPSPSSLSSPTISPKTPGGGGTVSTSELQYSSPKITRSSCGERLSSGVPSGAASPASSIDSGVVMGDSSHCARGDCESSKSSPAYSSTNNSKPSGGSGGADDESHRRVLFTIAGEVVPPPSSCPTSRFKFDEVKSATGMESTLGEGGRDCPAAALDEDRCWSFRERSVSECIVGMRQLAMRRQLSIAEEDEEMGSRASPTQSPTHHPHHTNKQLPTTPTTPLSASPIIVMTGASIATRRDGMALKSILKKSNNPQYYGSQQRLSPGNDQHFRRNPTFFSLCRSVSDLCEQHTSFPAAVGGKGPTDEVLANESNLLRMNHAFNTFNAFNAMVLEDLCEEGSKKHVSSLCSETVIEMGNPGLLGGDESFPKCASPIPTATKDTSFAPTTAANGSGSMGSLVSADSGDSMSAVEMVEMQPRKKRVSFSEHVQARIYRSNSSILGQKKKNEKKNRNKRRRSESESNTSTTLASNEEGSLEKAAGQEIADDTSVAPLTEQRRDSGIGDEQQAQPPDTKQLDKLTDESENGSHQSPRPTSLDLDERRALGAEADTGMEHAGPLVSSGTKCPPTSPTSPLSKRMRRLVSADSALGEEMLVLAAAMTMVGMGLAGDAQ